MSNGVEQYQDQLAGAVQAANPAFSEPVIQAFRTIPRHPFVDAYYEHDEADGRKCTRRERDESAAWYEQIYRDCALVTHVDAYGRTLSSSSQPKVQAAMLEALKLHPGMRVLEIGTGSGYNAALLAHLVGSPRLVTTIDLDAQVIARAQRSLPQVVGEGMTIVQSDGAQGYAANAPSDRIIVTASTPSFLQPGANNWLLMGCWLAFSSPTILCWEDCSRPANTARNCMGAFCKRPRLCPCERRSITSARSAWISARSPSRPSPMIRNSSNPTCCARTMILPSFSPTICPTCTSS
jgi:protein-L-isoaspartate O-methyltransferase